MLIRLLSKTSAQPLWIKLLINIALVMSIVFLGYRLIIDNIYVELNQKKQIEVQNKKMLVRYIAEDKTLNTLKGQVINLQDMYDRLAHKLPGDSELPELIDQLSDLAHQSKLKIKVLNPSPLEDAKDYAMLRIQLLCNGSFEQLTQFISQITNLPRIILIEKYTLTPLQKGNGNGLLKMMMTMKTFSLLSENN